MTLFFFNPKCINVHFFRDNVLYNNSIVSTSGNLTLTKYFHIMYIIVQSLHLTQQWPLQLILHLSQGSREGLGMGFGTHASLAFFNPEHLHKLCLLLQHWYFRSFRSVILWVFFYIEHFSCGGLHHILVIKFWLSIPYQKTT